MRLMIGNGLRKLNGEVFTGQLTQAVRR